MTGEDLRIRRKAAGVTIVELAEAGGLDPGLLSRHETGNRPLSRQRAEEIVALLAELETLAPARRRVAAAQRKLRRAAGQFARGRQSLADAEAILR